MSNFIVFKWITLGQSNSSCFKMIGQHSPSHSHKVSPSAGKSMRRSITNQSMWHSITSQYVTVRQLNLNLSYKKSHVIVLRHYFETLRKIIAMWTLDEVISLIKLYSPLITISDLLSESFPFRFISLYFTRTVVIHFKIQAFYLFWWNTTYF